MANFSAASATPTWFSAKPPEPLRLQGSLLGYENAFLLLSQSPHLGEEDTGQGIWRKCKQKLGSNLSLGEASDRVASLQQLS